MQSYRLLHFHTQLTMCCHSYTCSYCGTKNFYSFSVFMLVFTPYVSPLVLPLQRAQARCLVAVDSLTGAARWRMMRWGGVYTETCSGNSFYFSGFGFLSIQNTHFINCQSSLTMCILCLVTGGGYWVQKPPRGRERPPLALLGGMSVLFISSLSNHWNSFVYYW